MWQQWLSGAGLSLKLVCVMIVVSWLFVPAKLLVNVDVYLPGHLAIVLAGAYLIIVVPVGVSLAATGVGLRGTSDDEEELHNQVIVARKEAELRREYGMKS